MYHYGLLVSPNISTSLIVEIVLHNHIPQLHVFDIDVLHCSGLVCIVDHSMQREKCNHCCKISGHCLLLLITLTATVFPMLELNFGMCNLLYRNCPPYKKLSPTSLCALTVKKILLYAYACPSKSFAYYCHVYIMLI